MTPLLLTLAICTCPVEDVVQDRADVLEVHTLYQDDGTKSFTQLICWQYVDGEPRCFAWRIVTKPTAVPVYDHQRGCYVLIAWDGEVLRRITATSAPRTWTIGFDPELEDRQFVPPCKRRGLGDR